MTLQYINTGSSANAGDGDSIRAAFTKVNNNFASIEAGNYSGSNGGGAGYTGSRGYIGYTGSSGAAAAMGYTGSHGDIGYTGYIGSQGPIGYSGSQGELGYTGSKGDIGYSGSQGEIGYVGSKGDIGYSGSRGPIGYSGSQGQQGQQGSVGPEGPQGPVGPKGDQGLIGNTGTQGIQGSTGTQGIQGPIGLTGDQGIQGSTGTQGPRGFTGEQGVSVTLVGSTSTVGGLPLTGNPGDGWIVTDNGDLWFWSTINAQWEDIGQIVGPQGDPGAEGPAGPQGPIGNTGTQGTQGPIGLEGPQGPVGVEGPQGPIGNTGTQGIQGSTGTTGVGVVTGGTAGQVLAKIDGTDFNTEWIDIATTWQLTSGTAVVSLNADGELTLPANQYGQSRISSTASVALVSFGTGTNFEIGSSSSDNTGTITYLGAYSYSGSVWLENYNRGVGDYWVRLNNEGKFSFGNWFDSLTNETNAYADLSASTGTFNISVTNFLGSPTTTSTWAFSAAGDLALPNGANIGPGLGISTLALGGPTGIALVTDNKTWSFNDDGSLSLPYQATNSRTGTADALVFAKSNKQKSIATQPGDVTYNDAERLVIAGGDSYYDTNANEWYGEGGDLYLWAGQGGNGGDIKVDAGRSSGLNGDEGGTIKVRGGDSATGRGGFVEITGGFSHQAHGGDVRISAGGGATTNGTVNVYTAGTAHNWKFNPNGTLTAPGDILPNANLTYNLGSTSSQWHSLYVGTGTIYIGGVEIGVSQNNYVTVNGAPIITINTAGNITLQGDTIIGSVKVSDTAPDATTNGLQWFNTLDGRSYVSYGAQWIDASPAVVPAPSTYLEDITIDGSTLNINGATLTISDAGKLMVNGEKVIADNYGATLTASATDPMTSTGTLWFNTIEGRTFLKYNDQWVDINPTVVPPPSTYLGSITIDNDTLNINGATLTINTSGTLLVNGSEVSGGGLSNQIIYDGPEYTSSLLLDYNFRVDLNSSHATFNGAGTWDIGSNNYDTKIFSTATTGNPTNLVVRANNSDWTFGQDSILTFPNGLQIDAGGSQSSIMAAAGTIVGVLAQGTNGMATLAWASTATSTSTAAAVVVNSLFSNDIGTVQILTGEVFGPIAKNIWEFDAQGYTKLPYVDRSGNNNNVPARLTPSVHTTVESTSTGTVVYTGIDGNQHTVKLLAQVEAYVGSYNGWDTQSCEIMVARSFRNDRVVASVYGLTYTSDAPLATFTANLNTGTNKIEVVCTPAAGLVGNLEIVLVGTSINTAD